MTCWFCEKEECAIPCLGAIDRVLVEKGWVPISRWWRRVIKRAYASGKKSIVIRGGRRGGKSSTIIGRIAVAEMLSKDHVVPPGDVGWYIVLSVDKGQAKDRILTAHKALEALEIPHRHTTEEITLSDRPVGMKAIAATLNAVVSFTCIGVLCDEMARWRDKDNGANPAEQILTSLKPTMATMKKAIGWFVSAPWSTLDEHHKMVELGDTDAQCVFVGATWEMNPTLTEEETHLLEPDYQSWLREYAAKPMSADETKFFAAAFVDAAAGKTTTVTQIDADDFGLEPGKKITAVYVEGEIDRVASGADFAFRRNSSALVALERIGDKYRFGDGAERIPKDMPLVPSVTITDLAKLAVASGSDSIACDMHYIESVRETVEKLELPLLEFPTKTEDIEAAYVRTRVLLAESMIDLRDAPPKLLQQLKETTQSPGAGTLGIRNPIKGGAHGDWVSAFICAVWALDQPMPENKMALGTRRFPRGGAEPSEHEELTDLPPDDWNE